MAKVQKQSGKIQSVSFGKQNVYLLTIGIITIIIGYILMAQPPVNSFMSVTLAPIVLLVAYLFIIPFAIYYGRKNNK